MILLPLTFGCTAAAVKTTPAFVGVGTTSHGSEFFWVLEENCPHMNSKCLSVCVPTESSGNSETKVTGGLKVVTQGSASFTVAVPIGIEREQDSLVYFRINLGEHYGFKASNTISIFESQSLDDSNENDSFSPLVNSGFQVSFSTQQDELKKMGSVKHAIMTSCHVLSNSFPRK